MKKSRVPLLLSGVIFIIATIILIDGYGEFASGEESLLRWVVLPASQYIMAAALFVTARKQDKSSEATDA